MAVVVMEGGGGCGGGGGERVGDGGGGGGGGGRAAWWWGLRRVCVSHELLSFNMSVAAFVCLVAVSFLPPPEKRKKRGKRDLFFSLK